jgi:hypothetical protein
VVYGLTSSSRFIGSLVVVLTTLVCYACAILHLELRAELAALS